MCPQKNVLVIGATGKIGGAVCLEMAKSGYDVGVHYFHSGAEAERIAESVKTSGRHAHLLKSNLLVAKECDALIEDAYDELGYVDVLVHCASVYERMPIGDIEVDDWDEQVAINLRAPFFLSQAIGMRMAGDERGGSIVHFSDISSERPYGDYIPYCMCKAAIDSMVKGLAVKLAPRVRVNAVAPYLVRDGNGLKDEDIGHVEKMPLKRNTEPKEIANLVKLLCEDGSSITGQVVTVDGGRTLTW